MSWWKLERRPKSEEFRGIGLLYLVFAVLWTMRWLSANTPQTSGLLAAAWWVATLIFFWRSWRELKKEKTRANFAAADSM